MNLRTQLSSGTAMAKFLGRKQITLLNTSTTLNTSLHIFDDQEISEKPKNSTQRKLEKMSLTATQTLKLKKGQTVNDCNWIHTHSHLVHKRTLNHLAKLAK